MALHVLCISMDIAKDSGSGAPWIVLCSSTDSPLGRLVLEETFTCPGRLLVITADRYHKGGFPDQSGRLSSLLKLSSVRHASFVAEERMCILLEHFALLFPKKVKRAVLINPVLIAHFGFMRKAIDSLEAVLPLGIPALRRDCEFSPKPYLHRIRCPVLVLNSNRVEKDSVFVTGRHPTSWLIKFPEFPEAGWFGALLKEFEKTPAKCPQKSRG